MVGSLNTIATRDFASAYGSTGNSFLSDSDLMKLQEKAQKDLLRFMEPAPQKPALTQAPKPNPFMPQSQNVQAMRPNTVVRAETQKPQLVTPEKAEKKHSVLSGLVGLFSKNPDSWDEKLS